MDGQYLDYCLFDSNTRRTLSILHQKDEKRRNAVFLEILDTMMSPDNILGNELRDKAIIIISKSRLETQQAFVARVIHVV